MRYSYLLPIWTLLKWPVESAFYPDPVMVLAPRVVRLTPYGPPALPPRLPAIRTVPEPVSNTATTASPNIYFSTSFVVDTRVYHLSIEEAPVNMREVFKYRVHVRFLASSPATTTEPVPIQGYWKDTDGFLNASFLLGNLDDLAVFVEAAVAALQPIADKAHDTTQSALKPVDAPFEKSTDPLPVSKREAFRTALRRVYQQVLETKFEIADTPVAGTAIIHGSANIYRFVDFKEVKRTSPSPTSRTAYRHYRQGKVGPTGGKYLPEPSKSALAAAGYVVDPTDKEVKEQVGRFVVDHIDITAEEGTMAYIRAYGWYTDASGNTTYEVFENFSPIALSSPQDIQWAYPHKLYPQSRVLRPGIHITLGQVFEYHPRSEVDTNDFSPADGVYSFKPKDPLADRLMYKVPTHRILQARIFSDIVGLDQNAVTTPTSNTANPNGIIQLDVSRKFYLKVKRSAGRRSEQWGVLNYIEPEISKTKIEDAGKYLYLKTQRDTATALQNKIINPADSIRTIDLLRYTSFYAGFNINIVNVRVPNLKSTFYLDAFFGINRVPVRDSLFRGNAFYTVADKSLNAGVYGLTLQASIKPEKRYGANFRVDWMRYGAVGNSLLQVPSVKDRTRSFTNKFAHQDMLRYEMMLWANISKDPDKYGRLFFRPRFTYLRRSPSQNFFQAQLGYEFNIFSTQRSRAPIPNVMP